jgi:hypothetical protein
VALGSLAMIGRFSRPLWDALPFLPLVGFPFRFLVVATAAAALLLGGAVAAAPRRWRAAAGAAVAVLAVVAALPFRDARYAFLAREPRQMFVVAPESAAAAARNPRLAPPAELIDLELVRALGLPATAADEYLPRVAAWPPAYSGRAVEPMTPGVRVLEASWGYPEVRGEVSVTSPGAVALHQFAFPGWSVRVDGVERETAVEAVRGRIVVPVAPGDREIVARFGSTPLRRAAAAASVVAALLLAWLAVVERRRCAEARC